MTSDKIQVENVNIPGKVNNVNRAKYEDMKRAMTNVLPEKSPGLTQNEIRESVKPHLNQTLFPDGETCGWWAKTVQLDLEAKQHMVREQTKPLRWYLKRI